MKKKVLSILLALGMVAGLTACGGGAASEETPDSSASEETTPDETEAADTEDTAQTDSEGLKIGLCMNQATTQVISTMGNHMVDKAEELGAEATLVYYDMDVATMINQIENFISGDYDAIIVHPMNANDGAEAIQKAVDAGIIVATFDTIPVCDYTYSFTASNYELGEKIGTAAAKWAQENLVANGITPVIGLVNEPESEFLTERAEGIQAALEELLPEGEIVITAAGTTETAGLEAGENFLTAYPDMNVVCTINDDTAAGVYNAFSAAGYGDAQDRGLFSCDGTITSLTNVQKGGFHKICVNLSLPTVGENMVEAVVQDLTGETVTYEKDNYFPMEPVDVDNAQEAIDAYNG